MFNLKRKSMKAKQFINKELRRTARRITNLPILNNKNKALQRINYEGKRIY